MNITEESKNTGDEITPKKQWIVSEKLAMPKIPSDPKPNIINIMGPRKCYAVIIDYL